MDHRGHYKAFRASDHRFDGKFFVGVKTTKIYCRPICPAKPQAKNIQFFSNAIEAENAGFRPCLRCRPESAPGSPTWIGTSAIVKRAVKLLTNPETMKGSDEEFASRFGVTARHLRRLFIQEIGKTPQQLAQENRLNLSRKLIVETHLSISQIAFASGFRSVRRFNEAFKERFKRKPGEIRRMPLSPKEGLKVSLSYRPPFNYQALLENYKAHRVGNLEHFTNDQMRRVVQVGSHLGTIVISNDPKNSRLLLEIDFPDPSEIQAITSKVRLLFDLDSDPAVISKALSRDIKFKKILKNHLGIRLPSGWDSFEIGIATILGQLVSVERGRILLNDLIELLGKNTGMTLGDKQVKRFPSPRDIVDGDLTHLKCTNARKKTLKLFSQAVIDGSISLESHQNVDSFLKSAMAIPGIGPWTASYMALKCLRHTDAFPETDLILSRCLKNHSKSSLEKMRPWRGYAAALLWREYAGLALKLKEKIK